MKLIVLGAGESGVGAAILGKQKGYKVFVSDKGEIKQEYKDILEKNEIEFEELEHTKFKIYDADIVVKSPGIPDHIPLINELKEKGIEVISEIEFASRFSKGKFICITGSNGKTTTAMLTYHILKNGGLDVALVGNIGDSFAKRVAENEAEYYVIELSSFQIDGLTTFCPDIVILLNLSPDHLDRYEYNYQNYINSKLKLAELQNKAGILIANADDSRLVIELEKRNIKKYYSFSLSQVLKKGAFVMENEINVNINKIKPFVMSIHDLALKGKHNLSNTMAATIAAKVLDIRKDNIRESLQDFHNVEHRLEYLTNIQGVSFINDSKATNINSTWYALECQQQPVIWIVGGVDKGNDYDELMSLVTEKVKAIVCVGKDNSKIVEAFKNTIDQIVETSSMQDAVNVAYKLGVKDDIVLLSPACASFDLFDNYEDRGQQFKKYVRSL